MPTLLLPLLLLMFGVQSSVSMLITRVTSIAELKTPGGPTCSSRATSPLATLQSRRVIPSCRDGDPARDERPLDFIGARDMRPPASALETRGEVGAGWLSRVALTSRSQRESHLMLGPVLASWVFAVMTLTCQARFTDWAQLERDAAAVWSLLPAATAIAGHEVLALFPLVWVSAMSYSFFVMRYSFPPQLIEGTSTPKQVPLRNAKMVRHRLAAVDFSCGPSTTTL